MLLYNIISIAKIVIGGFLLRFVYTSIDPTQDPAMGLGFGFLGLFIGAWGVSFYLFFFGRKLFTNTYVSKKNTDEYIAKESYKLSLLFGIYVLINVGLLFLGQWTKLLGIILFVGFVGLQVFLTISPEQEEEIIKEF